MAQQQPAPFYHAVDTSLAPGTLPTIITSAGFNLLRAKDSTMMFSTGKSWVLYSSGSQFGQVARRIVPPNAVNFNYQDTLFYKAGSNIVLTKVGVDTLRIDASGDITDVGDVSSGAAFNGTQGTTLIFDNIGGDGILQYTGTVFSLTHPLTVQATDPADAEAIRLDNAEGIAWEASPTGTDYTLKVDVNEIMQVSGTFNAVMLTESANAVPNSTDHLGFFASTTSTQLAGVLSDESGAAGIFPIFNLTTPAQGDIVYYNGTNWVNLAPSTSGFVLHTQGVAANPVWAVDDVGVGAPADAEYIVSSLNGTLTNEDVLIGTANEITVTNGVGTSTLSLPTLLTLSTKEFQGNTIFIAEGLTANTAEGTFTVSDFSIDRTFTFPDNSGTFAVASTAPITLSSNGIIALTQGSGTDVTGDLEEETHVSEHADGGADELSVTNLSGLLADIQKVAVRRNSVAVSSRERLNFIEGTNITLTVSDDVTTPEVDITIAAAAATGDITSVGDVASGAAFDGTQGTLLTFNNAGGDGTLQYDGVDFTFSHAIVVQGTDPGDAEAIRLDNAEGIAWEASPTGTDYTLKVDVNEILQASGTFNAITLTENTNSVPNATDNLGFFASTTSAQLAGILSNETGGSGVAVFNSNPTLAGATVNGADLILNDASGDSPLAQFTPQTGTAWSLFTVDSDDDFQIQSANTAATENVDVSNPGTGTATLTVEGTITGSNLSGTNTGDQTITLQSDVTGSGTGTIPTTIADDAVDGTDIALGLDAQGDVMYYNGNDWARLAAGTSGQFLKTQGGGANPIWDAPSATVSWSSLTAPTAATSFVSNAGTETITFDFQSAFAADQFIIKQTTGTPTAGGSLLVVQVADADVSPIMQIENTAVVTVATGLEIAATTTGVITTAIDLDDAEIVTALAIGSNDVTVGGATISSTEFAILDNNISLTSEVTGTLPVGSGGTGVTALSDVLGTTSEITVSGGTTRVIGGNVTVSIPTQLVLSGKELTGSTLFLAEGVTVDANEISFNVTEPSADQTITFPNATGTVALSSNNLSFFSSTTSSQLAGVISNESGAAGVFPLFNLITPAQGDVIYFNGTNWVNLPPGTSGQFLQTSGAAANPIWATGGGGASTAEPYIAVSNTAGLSAERALAGSNGISLTDNGANSSIAINFVSSQLNNLTWGNNSANPFTWTFDPGPTGSNPSIQFGNTPDITLGDNVQLKLQSSAVAWTFLPVATNNFNLDVNSATNRQFGFVNSGAGVMNVDIDGALTLGTALVVSEGGTGVTSLSSVLGTGSEITVSNGTSRIIGGDVTISIPTQLVLSSKELTGTTLFLGEGASVDANEITFNVSEPSTDQTITFPNATGTVALSSNNLSFFSSTTSSQLAGVLSNESGATGVFPLFSLTSPEQGDVIYFNGTNWVNLPPGTNGQVLHTQGAAANPIWNTDDTGGVTAWDAIGDPSAGADIAFANTAQTMTWDTPATATALNAFSLVWNYDATAGAVATNLLSLVRASTVTGSQALNTMLRIENADDQSVSAGITITGGPILTAIQANDADINVALDIGANDVVVGGVTISSTEFAVLNNGIELATSDVSGTLPVANGGTSLTTYNQGDMIYSNTAGALNVLPKSTVATRYLSNTGTNNNPAWAQVDVSNGVTGTLAIANGGTGTTTSTGSGSVVLATSPTISNPDIKVVQGANTKTLTESSATSFVSIGVPALAMVGGSVYYTVIAANANDTQARSGMLNFSAVNISGGGGVVAVLGSVLGEAFAETLGGTTLTVSFSVDASPATSFLIRANATSSLTQTTLAINYKIMIHSGTTTVTPQ